jgi:GNAT superfamily N-acetyltransferase
MDTTDKITVRELTEDEVSILYGMAKQFHSELKANFSRLNDFDQELFGAMMRDVIRLGVGIVFVLENEGSAVGFIYGIYHHDPILCTRMVCESHWFIEKEHRSMGLLLLDKLKEWGKSKGAMSMSVGHFPHLHGHKMQRLYESLGFVHIQEQYMKEI